MDYCCIKRQYFFMLRKCGADNCGICRPMRGHYDYLHYLPDLVPNPNNPGHYKDLTEVYGSTTTEEYRPSLQEKATKAVGASMKELEIRACGETVRAVLHCEECDKPRCVYANKKMSAELTKLLLNLEEEVAFVFGSKFIPEDHPLYKVCFVLDGVTCGSDVSPHYFSSSSRLHFPSVCYVCGSKTFLRNIPQIDLDNFQSVHNVCEMCYNEGHTERKRGGKVQRGKKENLRYFQ